MVSLLFVEVSWLRRRSLPAWSSGVNEGVKTREEGILVADECEALIWAMECMKTLHISKVVFATDCSQLVKMVSTPTEWPAFTTHMEEFLRCKECFPTFTIQHIPRAQNTMADKLARGVRTQPSAIVYVDSVSPKWLSAQEST
ncbi:PREDICTED: uncharacterized protein LOC106314381 [Brassica oleracea var. oleracea]|uniref:uncharacterized protein LOC106314381 n=1 Tax=Brassica oleracea var. oleracea TaxID=109376 RepID=UPI0006A748DB|nr:PREDICTED: uncharacterized protein LOC106314381 [Brassica oleracea var. oleracea]